MCSVHRVSSVFLYGQAFTPLVLPPLCRPAQMNSSLETHIGCFSHFPLLSAPSIIDTGLFAHVTFLQLTTRR